MTDAFSLSATLPLDPEGVVHVRPEDVVAIENTNSAKGRSVLHLTDGTVLELAGTPEELKGRIPSISFFFDRPEGQVAVNFDHALAATEIDGVVHVQLRNWGSIRMPIEVWPKLSAAAAEAARRRRARAN